MRQILQYVCIYIKRVNGDTAAAYSIASANYRSDLQNNGYGNGNHGFVHEMDWSTLPEELLTVEVYAVDGSGYNPRIYLGYYNNKAMRLLGETDEEGYDFSSWMDWNVIQNCYSIGYSNVYKIEEFDSNDALDAISESAFFVGNGHGSEKTFQCSKNGVISYIRSETVAADTTRDYSSTKCVLLLACKNGVGREGNLNNLVNTLHAKGVDVVVGFSEIIYYVHPYGSTTIYTDQATCLWAKTFINSISLGKTVYLAQDDAIKKVSLSTNGAMLYGLDSIYIVGEDTTILKH